MRTHPLPSDSVTAPAPHRRRTATVTTTAVVAAAALLSTSAGVASATGAGHRAHSTAVKAATVTASTGMRVGGRNNDVSFSTMNSLLGPVRVTRIFYTGALPAKFDRGVVPFGVKLIVSYKTPSANTASYVKSIPATDHAEVAYHHEPEGDYASGATFVKEFDKEAALVHAANPAVPFDFISLGYYYRNTTDASYIPTTADNYYSDSYQRGTGAASEQIRPASTEPKVTNFIKALASKGKSFNGFTEYGRGVIPPGGTFSSAIAAARVRVIPVDAAWLAKMPTVKVWSYWYGTGAAGQWRFTDSASVSAWSAVENANRR